MEKENSYADLKERYPGYIIMIQANFFYTTFDESAIFFHKNFGYKLYRSGNRAATGFPFHFLEDVLEKIRELKYNYVVVRNYKIIEVYEKGALLDDEYEFVPDEVYATLGEMLITSDETSVMPDEIDAVPNNDIVDSDVKENEKKVNILLTISKSEHSKIKKLAKAKNKSINQYIRDIIDII